MVTVHFGGVLGYGPRTCGLGEDSTLGKMGSIWDTHTSPHSMWDLVPQPGVEPMPPALAARSFNHFTTRQVPRNARTLLMGILVCSDYKTPGPKSQAFPLHSSGARSPWSKCQDIQGLVSSLFLACRWPHSCCSPHVTFLCMYRHGRGGKREGSELRCLICWVRTSAYDLGEMHTFSPVHKYEHKLLQLWKIIWQWLQIS